MSNVSLHVPIVKMVLDVTLVAISDSSLSLWTPLITSVE